MSRINTNIPSMIATRVLNMQNSRLNSAISRLSTGLRINTGKDDPAGLIASEALRSEKVAIGAAITNASRATNVVSTAEGGLDEVNKLLTELEELVDRSANEAGISPDERDANQLQIDAILDSVSRIATSTEFQGKKLLNGTLAYTTSGVSTANFSDVDVTSARISNGGYRQVVVEITQSAQLGRLVYAGSATGNGVTSLQVTGVNGTEVLSFASHTGVSAVAAAINQSRDLTGVSATFNASSLRLSTTEYGADQFVTVEVLAGTFALVGGTDTDYGQDAGATVNGVAVDVDGLRAHLQTSVLGLEIELSSSFATTVGNSDTFYITGGGADFMISPTVNLNGLASLGIRSVSSGSLGSIGTGFLSTLASGQSNALASGNYAAAQRVIRESQKQVAQLRGRLGAFQRDTLETTANALRVTLENTTAAESSIRDTDFATETSELTRSQILAQAATSMLRIANQQPQQALALLQ